MYTENDTAVEWRKERKHYSVDIIIKKLREEDSNRTLQEAMDLACFHANQAIRKTGFRPHQLTFGKGATIPGFMDSTEVSDSTITHNGVKSVMSCHYVTQNTFKQANTDDRLKKMCNSRQRPYEDIQYQQGEKVIVKDHNNMKWEEATVEFHDRNKIHGKGGMLRTVSNRLVKPVVPRQTEA